MKKYVNGIGCIMEFEEGISQEQVDRRLTLFGKLNEWREVNK